MIRLRALEVIVSTGSGDAVFRMQFGPGLNILRAPNNSGKSTAMQAIIYALGLEGMFSARREPPLPHAMTERISLPGGEYPVISSRVVLEVENHEGAVHTIQRSVVDPVVSSQLVVTWRGGLLTDPTAAGERQDFFVRRPGSATRDAGFHSWLAGFLGWELPLVQYFDGSERPLYLEAIWPFYFVEQKQGWGGVRPRVPTYFGIRDVVKRAAEFTMDLSSLKRAGVRNELERRLAEVADSWTAEHSALEARARAAGGRLVGLPQRPTSWSAAVRPRVLFYAGDEPLDLNQAIAQVEADIAELPLGPELVEDSIDGLSGELSTASSDLRAALARLAALGEALTMAEQERTALERQIATTEEDRARLLDIRLLETLGSPHHGALFADHDCPTCHQPLDDVGLADGEIAMSIDDNVRLLEQRLAALNGMSRAAQQNVDTLSAAVAAGEDQAADLRRYVRAIKESLVLPGSTPNVASIERRLAATRQMESLEALRATVGRAEEELERLAGRSDELRARLADISEEYSGDDTSKIREVTADMRRQLSAYRFTSLPVEEIRVPNETLIPAHDGFDLGFDISASDGIRTKWAYHSALARLGSEGGTNHPLLLMFDEPGQQEIEPLSLTAFLRNAELLSESGVQIVIATSQELAFLRDALGPDTSASLTVESGNLLKPA